MSKKCSFCGDLINESKHKMFINGNEAIICSDCVVYCEEGKFESIFSSFQYDSFGYLSTKRYQSPINLDIYIGLESLEKAKEIISDNQKLKSFPKTKKTNPLKQLLEKYKDAKYVKANNNFLSENFHKFLDQNPVVGLNVGGFNLENKECTTFVYENSCVNDLGSFNPQTDYLIAIGDFLTIENKKFDPKNPIDLETFVSYRKNKELSATFFKDKIKNMTSQPFHFYKWNEEQKKYELKSEIGMFYYIFEKKSLEKLSMDIDLSSNELESFLGQEKAKTHAKQLLAQSKVSKVMIEKGIKIDPIKLNTLFVGAPGTGKTTFAKILGKILHKENLLSKGDFFLITKSNLVGEYVGHTENLVKKVVANAKGSVLFIDEAYNLIPKNDTKDFGHQALQTLMEEIDKCENDIMVIFGGYEHEIQRVLEVNDGYKRRFPHKIVFENYSSQELLKISELKTLSYGLTFNENQNQTLLTNFEKVLNIKNFGNGGYVTNLLEKISLKKSLRLSTNPLLTSLSKEELLQVEDQDIESAISDLMETFSSKKENLDVIDLNLKR